MIQFILSIAAALAVILGTVYLLKIRKRAKSKLAIKQLRDFAESPSMVDSLGRSATQIIKEFESYIDPKSKYNRDPKSKYNRSQRRRIKRHYLKFLWAWPDLTEKQRDISRIVHFLVQARKNQWVVYDYMKIVSGQL